MKMDVRFTLTIQASPGLENSISSSGNYEAGTQVSVYATPNEYYIFDKWEEDGNGIRQIH